MLKLNITKLSIPTWKKV